MVGGAEGHQERTNPVWAQKFYQQQVAVRAPTGRCLKARYQDLYEMRQVEELIQLNVLSGFIFYDG